MEEYSYPVKRTRKNSLPSISREKLEEAVLKFLESGGEIQKLDYIEPKQKNQVFSVESTIERHSDPYLDEVSL
jgi:hypothetical protein